MLGQRYIFSEVWRCNPRIQQPGEGGDVQIIYGRDPVTNMRPYHKRKTDERWFYNLNFRPEVGEIYLTDQEWAFAEQYKGRVIIEPHIKSGASPNKQWGRDKWEALVALAKKDGIQMTQLGPIGTRPIQGTDMIMTPSFRCAAAVMAFSRGLVLPEGGLSHCAAALNKRAVVIFGNFTPVELTGYPQHINMGASLDQACGMRIPCKCCKAAMEKITPEEVYKNLKDILHDSK